MTVQDTSLKKTSSPLVEQIKTLLLTQESVLLIITLIAVFYLSLQTDKFLTVENLLNQGRLMTEIGLMALPMTFIIITGGIDLSVGAIVGFERDYAGL